MSTLHLRFHQTRSPSKTERRRGKEPFPPRRSTDTPFHPEQEYLALNAYIQRINSSLGGYDDSEGWPTSDETARRTSATSSHEMGDPFYDRKNHLAAVTAEQVRVRSSLQLLLLEERRCVFRKRCVQMKACLCYCRERGIRGGVCGEKFTETIARWIGMWNDGHRDYRQRGIT